MKPCGSAVKFQSVNPRQRRDKTAKVKMVFNSDSITALGIERTDFVLDFLESAFDFPSCGVVFDDLFSGEREVGSDQGETEAFTVNEDDLDLAFKSLGHANEFGKSHVPFLPVKMDFSGTYLTSQQSGKFPDRGKAFTILGTASAFSADNVRDIVQHSTDSETAEHMDRKATVCSDFPKQRQGAEPAVTYDQSGMFETLDQFDNQFRSDAGFCFEPLRTSNLDFFSGLFGQGQVKLLNKRQTCPASMDKEQQSGYNPAVSENIFGAVGLGSMIVMNRAPGDMPAGFSVACVVKRQEQPAVNCRIADQKRYNVMESFPWQFRRVDESVEAFECHASSQKHGETAKNVADPSGLAAACQGDDESFENSPAVGGNDFGDLIEKMIEFHVRLLGLS